MTGPAFGGDVSAVAFSDHFADGKAEAGSLGGIFSSISCAVKLVEDSSQILLRDTDARVFHFQHHASVLGAQARGHGSARPGVADSVLHQVGDKLAYGDRIPEDNSATAGIDQQRHIF